MTVADEQKRFTIRQLLILAGLLVLVGAFFSKEIIKKVEAPFLYNIMEMEGKSTTELLANASVDALISQDIPYLQTIVNQTGSQNSNIISIEVLSDENTPLVQWTEKTVGPEIQKKVFSKSVTLEDEYFGQIIIHWRIDRTINEINNHASYLSYVLVCIAVVLVLFYLVITHVFVIKPVQTIESNLSKFNDLYQNSADSLLPKMASIGSISSKELYNLQKTVELLKELWEERAKREQDLVAEVRRRKSAELELQKHRDSLQIMVDDKTRDLKEALNIAESAIDNKEKALMQLREAQLTLIETEKMAGLGALVAGVGHEVNTPLSVVQSAITIVENDMSEISKKLGDSTLTKAELEKAITGTNNAIKIAFQNTIRIIDLMNSFKQIAVDQTLDDEKTINIEQYMKDIMDTLISLLKKQNITYHVNCPPNLYITTTPGAIAQIFTNLVNNSIKHGFTDRSNGDIKINLTMMENNQLSITYKDNGVGMSEEAIKHIFEPFYTTARGTGGTGLGMSIVFNLVTQKLKGNINITSQLNKGLTCKIVIPVGLQEN